MHRGRCRQEIAADITIENDPVRRCSHCQVRGSILPHLLPFDPAMQDWLTRPAAAPPPHPARTDRAAAAPPGRARLPARRRGRSAGARRRSRIGASASTCSALASRKPASPDWRVPRISPAPRRRRSSSAMRKPSLVSRISARRARAVSLSASGRAAAGRRCARSPRPTRPRSWWSWARPKRSASSTIISVALGTSTPTSITVVATSTASSPRWKARHHRVLLRPLHPAVDEADRSPKRSFSTCRALPRRRRGRWPRSPRPAGRPNRPARPPRYGGRAPSTTSSSRSTADHPRLDRLAARRHLVEPADVHLAIMGQRQRARDRRRGHHQQMRRPLRLLRAASAAGRRRSGAARRSPRGRARL